MLEDMEDKFSVYEHKEHQIHFGKKFYQRNDGYWVCTGDGNLLAHRWVWFNTHYFLPQDMAIHHVDGDKSNNSISNLQLISPSAHMRLHWRERRFNPNQLLLAI